MAYFALVQNGFVQQVIVAEQEFINGLHNANDWIETDSDAHDGIGLRANYAGIGYIYDQTNDVFYAPQPYPSWLLDSITWQWEAPVPYPTNGEYYTWDETTVSWKLYPASWNQPV